MIRVALDELSSNLILDFIKTQTKKSCSRKTIISEILNKKDFIIYRLETKKTPITDCRFARKYSLRVVSSLEWTFRSCSCLQVVWPCYFPFSRSNLWSRSCIAQDLWQNRISPSRIQSFLRLVILKFLVFLFDWFAYLKQYQRKWTEGAQWHNNYKTVHS